MLGKPRASRGLVAVLVALSLVVIIGVAAVAVDGGTLLHQRRHLQAAADAAALAAATDLYGRYPYNLGLDPNNMARSSALTTAAANGYDDAAADTTVTVSIPPISGDHIGARGYAEVVISHNQRRSFGGIFGTGPIPMVARAVAMGKWTDLNNGIIVLHPSFKGALTITGNGEAIVVGAGVVVDSNNTQAAITTGGGDATAPNFDITGVPGISTSGNGSFFGSVNSGVPPTPDPLAYLPEPNKATLPVANGGQRVKLSSAVPPGGITLYPGVYRGGIMIDTQDGGTITMQPGLYYMDGGGFILSSKAAVVANGVMVFNDPILSSDVISLSGGGNVHLSPITTGIYKGITLFQKRSSYNKVSLSGQGGMAVTGTVYAAHGLVQTTGQGENNIMGSQYICWLCTLNGNGSIYVNWNPQDTARIRIVRLME